MRLLVVGDAASPNVQRWCEALHDAGATVSVASFEGSWCPDIATHRLARWANVGTIRYYLAAPIVRRVASRSRPDAIIGYFATGYATLARLSGQRPLVVVTAGSDVLLNRPRTARHWVAGRNLRAADLVLAWAHHVADAIEAFGVDTSRLVVRPRGVRTDLLVRPAGAAIDRHAIVTTRSLEPFYRHDLLIEAMADPRLTHCRLTLVGGGSDEPRLRELARSSPAADHIVFLGRVPARDLPRVLAGHAVYASPSPSDGLSASLLEAMSVGLVPVV